MGVFSIRVTASILALAAATCTPLSAQAQAGTAAEARLRYFNVVAQPASTGIREFAKQAGLQIMLAGRDAEGRVTNAVEGRLDIDSALDRLLDGTGLHVRSVNGNSVVIVADVAAAAGDTGIITVTGSRIERKELQSVMPISVTNMDDALALGRTNAYDALARDPALGVGQNLFGAGSGRDAGISTVNLRNLGAQRSLTLIDGRRRVSSSVGTAAVDVGMIPVSMIDRIEIVTGGAAAIYGADAVTGAVNIITRSDIDGLNLRFVGGISEEGDAQEYLVSAATGGTFIDDRGTFSLGAAYSSIKSLDYLARYNEGYIPSFRSNPANTGPDDGIPDNLQYDYLSQPVLSYDPTYYLNGETYIVRGGVPQQFDCGMRFSTGELQICEKGGVRSFYDTSRLRGSNKSLSVMGKYDFEIADDIKYGGYFSYTSQQYSGLGAYPVRDDNRNIWFGGAGGAVAYLDNPYLPDAVRQDMINRGLTSLNISRTYRHFPWHIFDHDRESFTIGQTLAGKLGDRFKWNLFWQHGRTTDKVKERNIPIFRNWVAARDVITDPVSGAPVCRSAAARADGCLPLDIFGSEPPSPDLLAYVMADRREEVVNTQQIFGGDFGGTLFALPYGDISFAAGVEHRIEKLETTDDPLVLNGDLVHVGNGASVHTQYDVRQDVTEAFGEIIIPVLTDLPFAERLEVEGAYRYSDYSTVGGTNTWKAGVSWTPFNGLTLRGVRSRSVRTPNFGELYSPQNINLTSGIIDPCQLGAYNNSPTRAANCRALGIAEPLPIYADGYTVTTGGSPNIAPEISNSLTLGAVIQPAFLPGFDMVVDYWDIDIKNVITTFSAATIINLCVDLPDINNVPCSQITRDPVTKRVTSVQATTTNIGRLYARGIDFGLNYRRPMAGGQLILSLKGSWLLDNVTESTPGIPAGDVVAHGGWENPRLRATLLTGFRTDNFAINLETRFRGSSYYSVRDAGTEVYPDNTVPAIVYNDLSVQYRIPQGYEFGVGVRNITNQRPPQIPTLYFNGSHFDVVGRYFFVSANLKM